MPIFSINALRFEFLGQHALYDMHYSNIVEFLINIFSIVAIIRYHRLTITKESSEEDWGDNQAINVTGSGVKTVKIE